MKNENCRKHHYLKGSTKQKNYGRYHYLIGLQSTQKTLDKDSEFIIKYFLEYRDSDADKVSKSQEMINNKIWKTSEKEAIEACGCGGIVASINALKLSAQANMCNVYHFNSAMHFEEEWFDVLIDLLNKGHQSTIEQFKEAKIF